MIYERKKYWLHLSVSEFQLVTNRLLVWLCQREHWVWRG